jgi:hypothetical protein
VSRNHTLRADLPSTPPQGGGGAGFALADNAFVAGGRFLIYSLYYALTEGVRRALTTDRDER